MLQDEEDDFAQPVSMRECCWQKRREAAGPRPSENSPTHLRSPERDERAGAVSQHRNDDVKVELELWPLHVLSNVRHYFLLVP